MIIILEGNEANFKTTIAEKLRNKLNIPIVKGSSFELSQCTNEELFKHFKDFAEMDKVIFDRFIYSNRVYATLYKDYAILNKQQREDIEELIKDKAIIVYLHTDEETTKQRIRQRGDEYVNEDMVGKIYDVYHNVMMEANETLDVYTYNTKYWSSDDVVDHLIGVYK